VHLLEIFLNASDEFYLPEFVIEEIKAKQDEASEYIQHLIDDNKIEVRANNLISLASSLNARLGKGESEAIALCTELQADYVVLDDFAAKKEAMRLGLNVRGTLAIIRKLNSEGKIAIDNLDELYQRLMAINFRVKRSLFDAIFED
jgi:predicted nucleic acid-binding protein